MNDDVLIAVEPHKASDTAAVLDPVTRTLIEAARSCRHAPPPEGPATPAANPQQAHTHPPAGAAAPAAGTAHTTPRLAGARAGPAGSSPSACACPPSLASPVAFLET